MTEADALELTLAFNQSTDFAYQLRRIPGKHGAAIVTGEACPCTLGRRAPSMMVILLRSANLVAMGGLLLLASLLDNAWGDIAFETCFKPA